MESAGYYDLPKFGRYIIYGPPRHADSENIPHKLGFFVPYEFLTSLITARFHLGTITKIYTPSAPEMYL